jgi:periplasmic protein CpxP/Spy
MRNSKFLKIIIIFILIINVIIIGYFVFNNSKLENKKPMPREIVIQKLGFDAEQIKLYDVIIKKHQNRIKSLDDAIRKSKNELYSRLKESATEIDTNDSLVNQINHYQKQIEITHYNHFIEIKKICKTEQLAEFNALTNELSKIFSGKRKPKDEK